MEAKSNCESNHSKWQITVVVIGGIIIELSLGTVYTYGNFAPYLVSYMRHTGVAPDLRYDEALWIFAMVTMGQGLSGFIGGILERLIGPRLTTILGSWIMSAGVILTYFTVDMSFAACLITYGLVFGVGLGIAYPIPIGCAMRWMPERKGFVAGFVVAGFGGGAFIFNQVITAYINPDNFSPDIENGGEQYFSQVEIMERVPTSFLILGGTFALMQLFGTLLIRNPPHIVDSDKLMDRKLSYTVSIVGEGEVNQVYNTLETVDGSLQVKQACNTLDIADNSLHVNQAYNTLETVDGSLQVKQACNTLDIADNSLHVNQAYNTLETVDGSLQVNQACNTLKIGDGSLQVNQACNTLRMVDDPLRERKKSAMSLSEITIDEKRKKSGFSGRRKSSSIASILQERRPQDMLKSKAFYVLWFLFLANGQSMVFISTLYKAYGQTFIKDDHFLSLVGSFSSLCNAAGRILWGVFADKTSFKTSQLAITTILTCLFATMKLSLLGGRPVFFIWVCLIFLTFSGNFSTFPSVTMRCFGEQYYAVNYGIMFTSQALTAVVGSLLSHTLLLSVGWDGLFFVAAGISTCGTVIAFFFEEPDSE